MNYVYVLLPEKGGRFYTGSTNDLKRRFVEHNAGKVESTKRRNPFKLIYYEAFIDEKNARQREKYLKSGMSKKYVSNRLKNYLDNLYRDKILLNVWHNKANITSKYRWTSNILVIF